MRTKNGSNGVDTSCFSVLEVMTKKKNPSLDTFLWNSALISPFTAEDSLEGGKAFWTCTAGSAGTMILHPSFKLASISTIVLEAMEKENKHSHEELLWFRQSAIANKS